MAPFGYPGHLLLDRQTLVLKTILLDVLIHRLGESIDRLNLMARLKKGRRHIRQAQRRSDGRTPGARRSHLRPTTTSPESETPTRDDLPTSRPTIRPEE